MVKFIKIGQRVFNLNQIMYIEKGHDEYIVHLVNGSKICYNKEEGMGSYYSAETAYEDLANCEYD